ncbi:hypothetical protein D9Q98_008507 [Chlorella vulgaris]|uniref:Coiled-coil domain-containing protein 47 n=1 Tax=Chlorella vulgaris TaxID=3077 RepID=A0A9D4TI55_CHLVU|nr:hypothetical protein D9Q98_008507 [Chlorella vulgaris]
MAKRTPALCLLALLLGAGICCDALAASGSDDATFEDILAADDASLLGGNAAQTPPSKPVARMPFIQLKPQDSWTLEICTVAFLLAFLANIFIGRRRNEALAVAWTTELVAPGGVLDRNFALLGPDDGTAGEVLLKDSMHCYKLWASGRRHCQGMLATFNLMRRQDLLAYSVQAVRGARDNLELEVQMSSGSMPQLVLAIAPPATARVMELDSADIKGLCKRLEPTRDRIAQWPERLVVLAEHSSIFYDLMTGQLLGLAFGKDAFQSLRPFFRFLHITSDLAEEDGTHQQVIRLSFSLPPKGDTAIVDRFLSLALLLADLLACYRLSPEQQKRASEARQRLAAGQQEGGVLEGLAKRAEERRLQKLKQEAERLKRLAPDQRARELERKQKLQAKRRMAKMSRKI